MKDKLPIVSFIEAIKNRDVEISYSTKHGIIVSNTEKFIDAEINELINCHSDGINFIAKNTIIPQDISKEYIYTKYQNKQNDS